MNHTAHYTEYSALLIENRALLIEKEEKQVLAEVTI